MGIKTVTSYETDDGSLFKNKEMAIKYERSQIKDGDRVRIGNSNKTAIIRFDPTPLTFTGIRSIVVEE